MGRIGREVALRARALGMTVLAYDPFVTEDMIAEAEAELVPIHALWERSQIITLHLPLSPETRGMINGQTLAIMKQGVVIINCARGGLIDEEALVRGEQGDRHTERIRRPVRARSEAAP